MDIDEEISNQKDLNNLFKAVEKEKNIKYIIIDEVQNIENWGKLLYSMCMMLNIKIIVGDVRWEKVGYQMIGM